MKINITYKKSKGFTLYEVIASMVVISLLGVILVSAMNVSVKHNNVSNIALDALNANMNKAEYILNGVETEDDIWKMFSSSVDSGAKCETSCSVIGIGYGKLVQAFDVDNIAKEGTIEKPVIVKDAEVSSHMNGIESVRKIGDAIKVEKGTTVVFSNLNILYNYGVLNIYVGDTSEGIECTSVVSVGTTTDTTYDGVGNVKSGEVYRLTFGESRIDGNGTITVSAQGADVYIANSYFVLGEESGDYETKIEVPEGMGYLADRNNIRPQAFKVSIATKVNGKESVSSSDIIVMTCLKGVN